MWEWIKTKTKGETHKDITNYNDIPYLPSDVRSIDWLYIPLLTTNVQLSMLFRIVEFVREQRDREKKRQRERKHNCPKRDTLARDVFWEMKSIIVQWILTLLLSRQWTRSESIHFLSKELFYGRKDRSISFVVDYRLFIYMLIRSGIPSKSSQ